MIRGASAGGHGEGPAPAQFAALGGGGAAHVAEPVSAPHPGRDFLQ